MKTRRKRGARRNARQAAPKLTIASVAGSSLPNLGGGGSSALSGLSFGTIGGIIDRLGGLQGIIGAITKARNVYSSFRRFAPLLKVLWGAFSKKSDDTEPLAEDEAEPDDSWLADDGLLPPSPAPRKRRTRKRKSVGKRRAAKKKAA